MSDREAYAVFYRLTMRDYQELTEAEREDVPKMCRAFWNDMTDSQKEKYVQMAKNNKKRYSADTDDEEEAGKKKKAKKNSASKK